MAAIDTRGRPLPPQLVAALRRGDRLTALRLIRETYGNDLDLAQAMQILEGHLRALAGQAGGKAAKAAQRAAHAASQAGAEAAPAEQAARAALATAKARTQHGLTAGRPPTVMPGDRPGGMRWLLLALAALAAAAWWWLR
ncbi:hypothetical protein [Thermomonas flagellata]|uniref:hypothetical protein n=1 Tax=Thermomonas flagellata TaxID=2888524 RepID=UPI001F03DB50|nr:hypothetical protein [Thermomonas flagellata]